MERKFFFISSWKNRISKKFQKRIYVGLPDAIDRAKLFNFYLRKTTGNHSLLTRNDLETLAKNTEGYTGDDIANICREALMHSFRSATHFRQMQNGCFTPCNERETGAIPMKMTDVPSGKLFVPPISMVYLDFNLASRNKISTNLLCVKLTLH